MCSWKFLKSNFGESEYCMKDSPIHIYCMGG